MVKKILFAAVASFALAAPALAQLEQHQNPSLNGYVGHATDSQYRQHPAFSTVPSRVKVKGVERVGSGNPSLESFNPNAVSPQSPRFGTSPSLAENPDFNWIDQSDVGA